MNDISIDVLPPGGKPGTRFVQGMPLSAAHLTNESTAVLLHAWDSVAAQVTVRHGLIGQDDPFDVTRASDRFPSFRFVLKNGLVGTSSAHPTVPNSDFTLRISDVALASSGCRLRLTSSTATDDVPNWARELGIEFRWIDDTLVPEVADLRAVSFWKKQAEGIASKLRRAATTALELSKQPAGRTDGLPFAACATSLRMLETLAFPSDGAWWAHETAVRLRDGIAVVRELLSAPSPAAPAPNHQARDAIGQLGAALESIDKGLDELIASLEQRLRPWRNSPMPDGRPFDYLGVIHRDTSFDLTSKRRTLVFISEGSSRRLKFQYNTLGVRDANPMEDDPRGVKRSTNEMHDASGASSVAITIADGLGEPVLVFLV